MLLPPSIHIFFALTLVESLGIAGAALIVLTVTWAAFNNVKRYGSKGKLRDDACREILSDWAASRGLHFDDKLLKISGVLHDIDILINATYDQIEWSLPPILMMSTLAERPEPVVIQVAPGWLSLEEQVAKHRTNMGDGEFAKKFKVWSDPKEAASALLNEEICAQLISLTPEELLYDKGVIELRWEDDFIESPERSHHRLDNAFGIVKSLARK